MSTPADLPALLAAAMARDRNAFNDLLAALMPRLRSSLRGLASATNGRRVATSLANEAFIALHHELFIRDNFEFEKVDDVFAWMCQVAKNKIRDWLRRADNRVRSIDGEADAIQADYPSPAEEAERNEERARWQELLEKEEESVRNAIIRRAFDESPKPTWDELARPFGLTGEALRKKVERVVKRLRTLLGGEAEDTHGDER